MYSEWYDLNLDLVIKQRKLNNQLFSERTMWYLISTLSNVIHYLAINKIVISVSLKLSLRSTRICSPSTCSSTITATCCWATRP